MIKGKRKRFGTIVLNNDLTPRMAPAPFAARRALPVLAALFLAATLATACVGASEDDAFRIGVMESLTGPGESYGTVANQAKQMAADEINAAGGVDGRPLELVVEDSQCSAQGAVAAYRKLTSVDGVRIILGTSCSGAMLGAAPLAEADGVILFSGLASNPDIARAGDYIFRTQISDVEVGIGTGNLLWDDGIRRLATITESTDYAEGVRRTTVEQFEKRGGQVVAAERFSSDVTDFRSQLSKLIAAGPEALHLSPQSELRRHHSQTGPGTGVPRARLRRDDLGGHHRPGDCRGRRRRDEGHHFGPGAGQRKGPAGFGQFPGAVRLRYPALAPGFGLRQRPHRCRVPEADRR